MRSSPAACSTARRHAMHITEMKSTRETPFLLKGFPVPVSVPFGDCPVMLSSISGLYPQDASSSRPPPPTTTFQASQPPSEDHDFPGIDPLSS